jgi:hypothetical protein
MMVGMLALFCLRLATGLSAALLILSPSQINPRFYRTHFLAILGLVCAGAIFLFSHANPWLTSVLIISLVSAFLGSLVWSLQGAPGGRVMIAITTASLVGSLVASNIHSVNGYVDNQGGARFLINDLASAWLLGTATTAMLMGHSYLIAPAMSLTPLMRLLAALASAVLLQAGLAGWGLWSWTREASSVNLNSVILYWLPLRWAMSFLGPLVFGWMAWQSARIRSTQSATGILYVVVVFCYLGELTGQLLLTETGFCL